MNIMEGEAEVFHYHEIDDIVREGGALIDVREPEEFEAGNIEGAQNIPLGDLREKLEDLPKNKLLHVHCKVGLRGYLATRILNNNGFKAINLSGGYKTHTISREM